jgi:hypothetical protein
MANAPFPIPAHQTGRADFRHPAFRLASPQGTRRDCLGQALEAQNAEFSMNYIECESAIAAPLHLVPSREEPALTFKDVLVDASVWLAPRAVAKLVDQPRSDLFSLSHTSDHGSILLGTRRSPILVLSRCTLFLEGLAPRYQFPFASNKCAPNE